MKMAMIYLQTKYHAQPRGVSTGISNNVNQEHKDTAADFILFASDSGKVLQLVVPDREYSIKVVPTGQDSWRHSLLNEDAWVSRGYPKRQLFNISPPSKRN